MGITPAQFYVMQARLAKAEKLKPFPIPASQSVQQLNPDVEATAKKPTRIRQSGKPLMNKLESDYYQRLICQFPPSRIRSQEITLRLANGLRYTPDFFIFHDGKMRAYEVKGPQAWDDSLAKIKMAGSLYPEIQFTLAWKDQAKQWQEQNILP